MYNLVPRVCPHVGHGGGCGGTGGNSLDWKRQRGTWGGFGARNTSVCGDQPRAFLIGKIALHIFLQLRTLPTSMISTGSATRQTGENSPVSNRLVTKSDRNRTQDVRFCLWLKTGDSDPFMIQAGILSGVTVTILSEWKSEKDMTH